MLARTNHDIVQTPEKPWEEKADRYSENVLGVLYYIIHCLALKSAPLLHFLSYARQVCWDHAWNIELF